MSKSDLAVLGGGNAGYAAALRAAQLGLSVTLVEKAKVGGTCLHAGCIPTKALLHSAEVLDEVRRAGDFGILAGEPSADWGKILSYKDSVVAKLHKGLKSVLKARKVQIVEGSGRLKSAKVIEVEGHGEVEGESMILSSGSYARSLPSIPADGKAFITSDHALVLEDIPSSVIVVGAGAVGLEFASIYRSFGADVTILEALPRLAPGEDEDVSKEMTRQFTKRGIKCITGVKVTGGKATSSGAMISCEMQNGSQSFEAERCLIAIGRGPVSEGLGYEEAGVKMDRGFVVTDESCRTGVDGVWAVGDLITQPSLNLPFAHLQLAHVAFAEGIHVAEQIAGVETTPVGYLGVPRATYSVPEIASVGLTEQQATDTGHEVKASKFNWAGSGKASILGETSGFVKVVTEVGGPVLGVHMIGPRVTELISEAQLITNWEAMPHEVAPLIHPHPTLSEGLGEALLAAAGKQLHGA